MTKSVISRLRKCHWIYSTIFPAMHRFLALGDSYTIGEGVPLEAGWPARVARRLRDGGVDLADPRIIAVTGWTTDELAAGIEAAAPRPRWDLVTLAIGVNNHYRGRGLDQYRDQLRSLLARAVNLAGEHAGHVLMISIPDWGVTRFARSKHRDTARMAAEMDAFNAAACDLARAAGAGWVDVTTISRGLADAPDMLAADGLHPSAAQYAIWADTIAPVAYQRLAGAP
jgi:lysophospholipase L1-like esterase